MFKITAEEKRFILRRRALGNKSWLSIAEKVVKEHQMVYVNPKTLAVSDKKKRGFTILDATTANMLVKIANALKPESREKFINAPLDKAVRIGWQMIK